MTSAARLTSMTLHGMALVILLTLAISTLAYTIAAALGLAPWLNVPLQFGDAAPIEGGAYIQMAVVAILVALAFFVPTSARVLRLENNHRTFALKMEDVTRAYHYAHAADRSGLFTLSSEFDAVRERIAHLRDHPDLADLEADVIEVAAQMSHASRHLADIYNDDKVARAKAFLTERQEEVERQQEQILEAQRIARDLRRWGEQIHLEESVVKSQLERLHTDLREILPELGLSYEDDDKSNVVRIANPAE